MRKHSSVAMPPYTSEFAEVVRESAERPEVVVEVPGEASSPAPMLPVERDIRTIWMLGRTKNTASHSRPGAISRYGRSQRCRVTIETPAHHLAPLGPG